MLVIILTLFSKYPDFYLVFLQLYSRNFLLILKILQLQFLQIKKKTYNIYIDLHHLLNINVFNYKISLTAYLLCRFRSKLIPEVPSPVIDAAEFIGLQNQVSNTNCWRNKTYFQRNNLNILKGHDWLCNTL